MLNTEVTLSRELRKPWHRVAIRDVALTMVKSIRAENTSEWLSFGILQMTSIEIWCNYFETREILGHIGPGSLLLCLDLARSLDIGQVVWVFGELLVA